MQSPAHTDASCHFLPARVPGFALISDELNRVGELMDRQLESLPNSPELTQMVESFKKARGKMLRPGLLLLAGKACGQITSLHIDTAAVVEMIHTATLLHDDVIDQGKTRRGRATVNSLWGNQCAVLLGDFLLSRVFQMSARLGPEICRLIAETTKRICTGELTQVTQRRNFNLGEAEYVSIITEKSASFFACCCRLGALLAGAKQELVDALAGFGLKVGIAFQITDDLLDLVGAEQKTGKTLRRDVDDNKPTLAVIHLLTSTDESERKAVEKILSGTADCRQKLSEMLNRRGSLRYADRRARQYVTEAITELALLSDSDAKKALIETAEFAACRTS
jgi:octaprenyl-diphosphate synthase